MVVDGIEAVHLTSGLRFAQSPAGDIWATHPCIHISWPLLRARLANAGVNAANLYSAHSLRRAFANWVTANGWDIKPLMQYVGWKNVPSALRYVDSADPFAKHCMELERSPFLPARLD